MHYLELVSNYDIQKGFLVFLPLGSIHSEQHSLSLVMFNSFYKIQKKKFNYILGYIKLIQLIKTIHLIFAYIIIN